MFLICFQSCSEKTSKGFKEDILWQMLKLSLKVMGPLSVPEALLSVTVILPLIHVITIQSALGYTYCLCVDLCLNK